MCLIGADAGDEGCAGVGLRAGATKGPGVGRFCAKASLIASVGVRRADDDDAMPTGITPPHVEQRALTPPSGTFAGSTR